MARKPKVRTDGWGSVYREQLQGRRERFVAQIHVEGKKIRRVASTREEAERLLETLRHEKRAGKDLLTVQPTLLEWRKTCHKEYLSHLRPNVIEDYDSIARTHIDKSDLANIPLDKITRRDCQRLLQKKAASGLAYYTVRNIRAVLRRYFGIAKLEDLIINNPADELKIPLPAIDDNQRAAEHTWTHDEAVSFLMAIEGHRLEAVFYLAVTLGARLGELCGLCWSDIDLKAGTIYIRRQLQRIPDRTGKKVWALQPVKTNAGRRTLKVDQYGLDLLQERYNTQMEERKLHDFADRDPFAREGGLVFTSELGRPIHGSNLGTLFKQLVQKAGIPNIRFHDQRHTCASLMLAFGEAVTTVSAILGHRSPSITTALYSHAIRGHGDEAISRHAKRLRRSE